MGFDRCAEPRFYHSASLAGYRAVKSSTLERPILRIGGCVRPVISDYQIDGRCFAF